jgi:hypothetical protein
MKLSDELKQWGYHADISDEGKGAHLRMSDEAAKLEAENEKMNDYIEQFCDEDFVMWCREQDDET